MFAGEVTVWPEFDEKSCIQRGRVLKTKDLAGFCGKKHRHTTLQETLDSKLVAA